MLCQVRKYFVVMTAAQETQSVVLWRRLGEASTFQDQHPIPRQNVTNGTVLWFLRLG